MVNPDNLSFTMKKLFLFSLLFISVILFQSCDSKEGKTPLVIGMELQFPPFEMTDGEGNPAGISVEMAKALGEHLGREVKIENTAWTGLIPSLQSGKIDAVISSMSITDKRSEVVDFSIPYAASGLALMLHKGSKVKEWNDVDKKGVVVAVKSGTIGAVLAKDKILNAEVRYFEETASCVLEVAQAKADLFLYDPLTIFKFHKKHQNQTRINLSYVPGTVGKWAVAVKKGNTGLKKEIDAFILQYRKDGKFEVLEKKYLGELKAVFDQAGVPSFFNPN